MRLQEISMLIAAGALVGLAIAALVAAFRPVPRPLPEAPLPPIEVSVMNPDRPLPELNVTIAPPEPSADDQFSIVALPGPEGQPTTLVVQRRLPNPIQPDEPRWTLTFYAFNPSASDRERLQYLGSRCVEYDMGPDLMGLDAKKGYEPYSLKKALENAKKD
jgi:hypothetical protein